MIDDRIRTAARRIMECDESRAAAVELESAILEVGAGDERFDDLLEALSLYAPGNGMPYYEPSELQAAVLEALGSELFEGPGDE